VSEKVTIRLTENSEILDALRDKQILQRDAEGKEFYSRYFDSLEIRFYPGIPLFLNRTVAEALRQSSEVSVGPYIGSWLTNALEIVSE